MLSRGSYFTLMTSGMNLLWLHMSIVIRHGIMSNQECDLQTCVCLLQALRRQISALEAQKKDLKGGMAKVKASCEQKANENEALRAQIKVTQAVTGM